jgi:RNA polymerase sigma-70 factor (ECF subfamily)
MLEDKELVERCLQGDAGAFEGLVSRYQEPVYRVVRRFLGNREDALEISQETFARAWQKLAMFDPSRKFSTWIFTVAGNLARDVLRRKKRRPEVLETEMIVSLPGGDRPENSAVQREEAERLRAAVETLSEDKRLAVVLRYFEGMPLAEVAEITGTEVSTLKVRLFRARKDLMKMLEQDHDS